MVDLYGGSPPVHYANIVKGECNAKQKNTFFEFVLPSRLLILSIVMRIYTIFAEDRKRIGISCCLCVHIKNMNFCLILW